MLVSRVMHVYNMCIITPCFVHLVKKRHLQGSCTIFPLSSNSFYADFGPLNLAMVYRYCCKLNKKLKVMLGVFYSKANITDSLKNKNKWVKISIVVIVQVLSCFPNPAEFWIWVLYFSEVNLGRRRIRVENSLTFKNQKMHNCGSNHC